jgi:hypothetical protein
MFACGFRSWPTSILGALGTKDQLLDLYSCVTILTLSRRMLLESVMPYESHDESQFGKGLFGGGGVGRTVRHSPCQE